MSKSSQTKEQRRSAVTWRAVLLGLLLTPVLAYWTIEARATGQGPPTTVSLFYNVVFVVFLLICGNLLLAAFLPRWRLTQAELLTVYTMLSLTAGLAGLDVMEVLMPLLTYPFRFATPENEWAELFHHYIPNWFGVRDPGVLETFFRGETTLYLKDHLLPWIVPSLAWTGFLFALVTGMLGINLLVRKQWTEHEKLSYPIIQLPWEITLGGGLQGALRSPWLWAGSLLAGAIDVINGLNFLYPSVPSLGGKLTDLQPIFFTNKPWNAMGWTPIGLFPFAVGMAFFIPLDLSFSAWFFYLFWKAERVLGGALGLRNLPSFPYVDEQSFGAYLGLCVIALVASRRHLAEVARRILGRGDPRYEAEEPIRFRSTLVLLALSLGFLYAFSRLAGMSTWVFGLFFLAYYAIATAVTRMRAELGSPVHDLHFIGPDEMLPKLFGTRALGPRNLTVITYYFFFNRAHRGHPMPHQLEGFKLAERGGYSSGRLVFAMTAATLLAILATFWAYYHVGYRDGALIWFADRPFNRLQRWLTVPQPPDYGALVAAVLGFVQTVVLMAMRMRFVWWPFHPAGFAISSSWSMNVFWFSILVSSVIKWIILRQGGLVLHRRLTPFFLGLILGEFVVGGVWNVAGTVLRRPMYRFLF
ncbi:MAG: hypothetical protein KatS3mg115_2133 [Candidatus Poribacteria bacterium]|nr:MAG: hypothetical protein KatS3mg115_2133 [Candidatus Poribacteria bacterium]